MTIRTKLALLLTAFVIALALLVFIQVFNSFNTSTSISIVEETSFPEHRLANDLLIRFENIDKYLETAALTGETVLIDNARNEKKLFEANLKQLIYLDRKNIAFDELSQITKSFEAYFQLAIRLTEEIIHFDANQSIVDNPDQESLFDAESQKIATLREQTRTLLNDFASNKLANLNTKLDSISKDADSRVRESLIISLIFVFIFSIFLFYLARSIVRPLAELSSMTHDISSGDYEKIHLLPGPAKDELGLLAQSFTDMASSLQQTTVSRNYFDSIIQSMADMLFVVNSSYEIVMVNQASLIQLGFDENDLIGKPINQLIKDDLFANEVNEASDSPYILKHVETSLANNTGNLVPVSFSCSKIEDKHSEEGWLVCVASDITSQKRAEQAERRARAAAVERQQIQEDKMASMGILVSGVAHEVNNPNHMIAANTTFLQKAWESTKPILDRNEKEEGSFNVGGLPYAKAKNMIPQALSIILGGSERINIIVSELRDFARENPIDISKEININDVVNSATLLMSNLIKKSTDNFQMDLANNLPLIHGNHQKLEQVIINLITNACQALEESDQMILITTYRDSDSEKVVFRIADEGIGMSEETMSRILDPFFTTKREKGGTGLGLSISSRIIKNHGGTLEFKSSQTHGTTFEIILPVAKNNDSDLEDQ